ncbi:MAG: alpha/beta hydrolase [Nocardioides sp.]|nr:alpha/beta hydrolase [Nocardioides sp.]
MSPAPRRALILPGRRYSPALPLLQVARRVAVEHGWSVREVWWQVPASLAGINGWVADRAAAAMTEEAAVPPEPERWLFIAKSLGTRVVRTGPRADAYVLLTPLLTSAGVVASVTALVTEGVPVLLVGGTEDELWSPAAARATGARLLEVPGADHGLEVPGDPGRTAEILDEVAGSVSSFLAALPL